ncbi:MAG: ABC transporter ATP-binding protein [Lentisphaerae bacterium]|jgi:ABC-type glutathione transport system ATPase component|nr:ABC transporter ATP-binding protein [Lentisphaerota bacterium]
MVEKGPKTQSSLPLLEVENLVVEYKGRPPKRAVNGVSFSVQTGQSVGIVGGSGCGKTTIAKTIVGLQTPLSGRILFEGHDLFSKDDKNRNNSYREIQMVFQDTLGALNPRMRIGSVLAEVLKFHRRKEFTDKAQINIKVLELLDMVELTPDLATRFPHEISGGQRQRVGIARALAVKPRLLIADEPVSALDVAVQAQMLKMLHRLLERTGLTMIFIAHDLAVVRNLCDHAIVMDSGIIVEQGDPRELFSNPAAEFTRALVAAVPDVSRSLEAFKGPDKSDQCRR